ncbi:MAG: hypothetical protein ACM30G_05020 [Micromonosporaceae bacterium]
MTAPTREIRLHAKTTEDGRGLLEAARDLERTASSVDKLGGKMRATSEDSKRLAKQVEETGRRVEDLRLQIARTGDTSLFGDLGKEEAKLRRLQRLMSNLNPDRGGGFNVPAIGGVPGPLIAGGAAAALAMAPAIGGIIAAAVVGGVGTGGLIGGAVLAAQDSRVKSAWAATGRELLAEFGGAAKPLVAPLEKAAKDVRTALGGEAPAFAKDMAVIAKSVDPITHSITGFIHELHPGLSSAFKASIPLARQFDKEMSGAGRAGAIMLDDMADAAPGAKDALHDLFLITDQGTIAFGELTKELSGLYDLMHKIPLSDLAMENVPWFGIIGTIGQLRGETGATGDAMSDAAKQADELRKALLDQAQAADRDTAAIERNTDALRNYETNIDKQQDSTEHYYRALLDLTDSVKENGTSLAINTREGLANRDALEEAARASREMRDAGLLTDAAYTAQIQSLVKMAVQLGFNRDQVLALIGALEKTPKQVVTEALLRINTEIGQFHNVFALKGSAGGSPTQQGRGGTDFSITPVVRDPDSRAFLDLPSRDVGGPVLAGRSYRIGGKTGPPEILTMGSQSGSVTPIGGGSAQTATVVFDFRGTEDAFAAWFRKATRIEGGTGADSVQAAWGQ